MKKCLIDAGPLIALFDRDDHYHGKIKKFLEQYVGQLFTTWPVVTEVLHMLDFNVRVQIDFLKWIERDAVQIITTEKEHLDRIIKLTAQYADRPMDFADATLLVASEATGITEIITIDSDFFIYRNIRKEVLKNIFVTK